MLQPNQYIKLSPLWLNKCLKNKKEGRREGGRGKHVLESKQSGQSEVRPLRETTLVCVRDRLKMQILKNHCEKILEALKI